MGGARLAGDWCVVQRSSGGRIDVVRRGIRNQAGVIRDRANANCLGRLVRRAFTNSREVNRLLPGIDIDGGRIGNRVQCRRIVHRRHVDVKGLDGGRVHAGACTTVVMDLDGNKRGAVGISGRRVSQITRGRDRGLGGEQGIVIVRHNEIHLLS